MKARLKLFKAKRSVLFVIFMTIGTQSKADNLYCNFGFLGRLSISNLRIVSKNHNPTDLGVLLAKPQDANSNDIYDPKELRLLTDKIQKIVATDNLIQTVFSAKGINYYEFKLYLKRRDYKVSSCTPCAWGMTCCVQDYPVTDFIGKILITEYENTETKNILFKGETICKWKYKEIY